MAQGHLTSQRDPRAFPTRPAHWPSPLLENLSFGPSIFGPLELEVLPLERNGVVEEELRGTLETLRL